MRASVSGHGGILSPRGRPCLWRHAAAMGWVMLVLLQSTDAGLAYEVIEVRHGGAVTGNVALTGVPQPSRQFTVRKGAEVCGAERVLTKVDVHHGMVSGVIIALEGVEQGKPFPSYQEQADEHGHGAFHYTGGDTLNLSVQLTTCNFGPFTGVMTADDAVQFVNHDSIRHTLHTYALQGRNTKMLKTVHTQVLGAGSHTEKVFPAKRLRRAHAVALTCDRHDFMENWLYLAHNPYYAISDKAGRFRIDRVPPGDYLIVAWHPVLGTQKRHVTIAPRDRLIADFEFTS